MKTKRKASSKGFFGATESLVNKYKGEVTKDFGLAKYNKGYKSK